MSRDARPPLRDVDDIWCWMNTWGDIDKHGYHGVEKKAYEQAMMDLLRRFAEIGVHNVPDEAWRRWTGH